MHEAMKKRGTLDVPEVKSLDVVFRTQLSNLHFPEFNYIYTLYSKYDKYGTLPFEGCHADQPARLIEIFDVIGAIHSEEEKRQRSK